MVSVALKVRKSTGIVRTAAEVSAIEAYRKLCGT
jgi:hypothetical protein